MTIMKMRGFTAATVGPMAILVFANIMIMGAINISPTWYMVSVGMACLPGLLPLLIGLNKNYPLSLWRGIRQSGERMMIIPAVLAVAFGLMAVLLGAFILINYFFFHISFFLNPPSYLIASVILAALFFACFAGLEALFLSLTLEEQIRLNEIDCVRLMPRFLKFSDTKHTKRIEKFNECFSHVKLSKEQFLDILSKVSQSKKDTYNKIATLFPDIVWHAREEFFAVNIGLTSKEKDKVVLLSLSSPYFEKYVNSQSFPSLFTLYDYISSNHAMLGKNKVFENIFMKFNFELERECGILAFASKKLVTILKEQDSDVKNKFLEKLLLLPIKREEFGDELEAFLHIYDQCFDSDVSLKLQELFCQKLVNLDMSVYEAVKEYSEYKSNRLKQTTLKHLKTFNTKISSESNTKEEKEFKKALSERIKILGGEDPTLKTDDINNALTSSSIKNNRKGATKENLNDVNISQVNGRPLSPYHPLR